MTYITNINHNFFKVLKCLKCISDQIFFSKFFSLYIKMPTGYYQKNKERLQKEACERYQNLLKEEKKKKQKYSCERYQNLFEEGKEKKRQYYREHHENLPKDKK